MSANQCHSQCHTGWKSFSSFTMVNNRTLPATKWYIAMGLTTYPLTVSPMILMHKQLLGFRILYMASMLHANRGALACTVSPHYCQQQLRQLTVSSMGYSRHQLRQIAVRQLTVSSMGYSCQQLRQLTVSGMGYSRQQIRQLTMSRMRLLNNRQAGTAQTRQCLLCQQKILLGIGPGRIIGHT